MIGEEWSESRRRKEGQKSGKKFIGTTFQISPIVGCRNIDLTDKANAARECYVFQGLRGDLPPREGLAKKMLTHSLTKSGETKTQGKASTVFIMGIIEDSTTKGKECETRNKQAGSEGEGKTKRKERKEKERVIRKLGVWYHSLLLFLVGLDFVEFPVAKAGDFLAGETTVLDRAATSVTFSPSSCSCPCSSCCFGSTSSRSGESTFVVSSCSGVGLPAPTGCLNFR
jgi:hypothetical protein